MAQGDVTATISKPSGKALYFDGTDDRVTISNPETLDSQSAISISFWIKSITDATARAIICRDGWDNKIRKESNNNLMWFIVFDDATNSGEWEPYVLTTSWTHITLTWSSSNGQMIMYVNGSLHAKTNKGAGKLLAPITASMVVGNDATEWFKGTLADVRLYNREITSDEVTKIYRGKNATSIGLIGYWSFNNTADPGHDDSGNGNDGTISGAVSTGGHDTIEDDIKTARATAGDKWNFIPLANGQQVMMVRIEEA